MAKYREKGEGFTNDIIASIRRSAEPCELGGGDNGARLEHSGDPRGYEHPLVAAIHSWKKEQRRQREHHAQQPRRDACPQPALQPRQRLAAQPEPIQRQRDVQGEKGLFPSGIHVSRRAEPGRNHHRAVNQLASFQRAISLPPPFRFDHPSLDVRLGERKIYSRFFLLEFSLWMRTLWEGRALFIIEINFGRGRKRV